MTKAKILLFCVSAILYGQAIHPVSLPDIVPGQKQDGIRAAESYLKARNAVLPHLAMGGYWQTTLIFTNMSASERSETLIEFFSPSGLRREVTLLDESKGVPMTANAFTFSLPPSATLRATSVDSGSTLIVWARYGPNSSSSEKNHAAVHTILRQQVPWRPPYEAVVGPDWGLDAKSSDPRSEPGVITPFNNRMGWTTSIAIANNWQWEQNDLTVETFDATGLLLGRHSLSLAPLQQTAFETWRMFPETAGRSGSIVIRSSNYGAGLLALQFAPDSVGVFTTSLFYERTK